MWDGALAVINLTGLGVLLLVGIPAGAFFAALAVGLTPMRTAVRAAIAVAGVVAALIVGFAVPENAADIAALALILAAGVIAWFAGFAVAAFMRSVANPS